MDRAFSSPRSQNSDLKKPRRDSLKGANRYRPMVELLEERTLLNAVSWIGAADGFWDVGANWFDSTSLTSHVPNSGDNVTINPPGNITVTVRDARTVNVLQSDVALVLSAGSLTVNGAASEIDGTLTLSGGDLVVNGATTLAAATSWQTGTIFGNGVTNTGTLTLSGAGDKTITGNFNNSGMIVESGAGNLVVNNTFANSASGIIDFQSDAGISGNAVFNQSGTIKKSAGAGISRIGPAVSSTLYFNQLGGTLDAQTGTLQLDQDRTSVLETGGTWNAETGATLEFVGNTGSGTYFAGAFSGSGGGTVQLSSGFFGIDSGGATFNFPTGLLHWVGGQFFSNPLTNSGSITLSGAADKTLAITLNNNGTLIETGIGNLVVAGTLNNNAAGLIDLQSDTGITGNGVINNRGTIQKSAGAGISRIGPAVSSTLYFNQLGGTLDAQTGTLQLDQDRTSALETGGTWNAATGAFDSGSSALIP